jgi:hypothetical protein
MEGAIGRPNAQLQFPQSAFGALSDIPAVAGTLQAAGLIRDSRGMIEILDRKALEASTCECCETIKKDAARILPQ